MVCVLILLDDNATGTKHGQVKFRLQIIQLSKANVTQVFGCIILGTNILDKMEACVSAVLVSTRFTSSDETV